MLTRGRPIQSNFLQCMDFTHDQLIAALIHEVILLYGGQRGSACTDRSGCFGLPLNLVTLCLIPFLVNHLIVTYSDLAHYHFHLFLAHLVYIQSHSKTPRIRHALPIVVRDNMDPTLREDNIITALEHNNRVSNLELYVAVSSQWENVLAAMQVPFPTPTDLVLKSAYETAPIVPDTVFGWICTKSAISLVESRSFSGITGAAVVATGTHLVYLQGYISTQAMEPRRWPAASQL